MSPEPAAPGRPRTTRRVRIEHLEPAVLRALALADLTAARAGTGTPLSPWLVDPVCVPIWRMRAEQVATDPGSARWVTGVVLDADELVPVGRAGFHGPPDGRGMVEVGYAIDPARRRQGYGTAVLAALVERARAEPGVVVVRASVAPGNTASLALVTRAGFVHVGDQVDEEDGPELVHELVL
ncbi:GNAT family N-acetyltransferase [Auraticoccus monumenti]|uniref:Protein N-acetyltransferase, RimJ/RimL family n=1 Tax=Auraticoccus monumenti TaxID=675864 RepID=A0A1G7B168_9ACTN|nr:GNAT family protein [Auraticoccus monumenti]SDE19996.1 Protein N-acetyltransferase, RimJ/RimL family [Auraticoccus monumenti]